MFFKVFFHFWEGEGDDVADFCGDVAGVDVEIGSIFYFEVGHVKTSINYMTETSFLLCFKM